MVDRPLLVGFDGSGGSVLALARARILATENDSTVVACRVVDPSLPTETQQQILSEMREDLPDLIGEVRTGTPFVELIRLAREIDAERIVLGATGHHSRGPLALGATVDRVARKADRPVLVVRLPANSTQSVCGRGVDGSEDAAQAARLAQDLSSGSRLVAVLAVLPIGEHLLGMRGASDHDLAEYRAS